MILVIIVLYKSTILHWSLKMINGMFRVRQFGTLIPITATASTTGYAICLPFLANESPFLPCRDPTRVTYKCLRHMFNIQHRKNAQKGNSVRGMTQDTTNSTHPTRRGPENAARC